jgi:RNA polymerase sigma factor (sigma-70 family)
MPADLLGNPPGGEELADIVLFRNRLITLTRPDHIIYTPVGWLAGATITDFLYLYAKGEAAKRALEALALGRHLVEQPPTALASGVLTSLGLMVRGVLQRLRSTGDKQLADVTNLTMYQELLRVVTFRHPRNPLDVAHELFVNLASKWAEDYDPDQSSFRTFLSRRILSGALPAGGRWLGLGKTAEVPVDFEDPGQNMLEDTDLGWENDVEDRVVAVKLIEKLAGPRSTWPQVAIMKYVAGLSNAEIAERLHVTQGAVRANLSRFHAGLRKASERLDDG